MPAFRDLLTADWHLSHNRRDAYRFGVVNRMRDIIRQQKIDRLFLLGDLTEFKEGHDAWMVNRIVDDIRKLADTVKSLHILRGNHDYIIAEFPFFRFLNHLPNVEWVNEPSLIGSWLLLPHTRDYKRDWSGLDFSTAKLILAHNTFQGAVGVNGHELDGIPLDVFGANPCPIISGDVHLPQKLGPVTYVGAPHSIYFGDDFEPRVLMLESDGARFVRTMTSITISGPRKVIIDINKDRNGTDAKSGDIVRIRVHLAANDVANWNVRKANLMLWAQRCGFIVDSILPLHDKSGWNVMAGRTPSAFTRSDDDVFADYCKRHQIDPHTMKTGQVLMR